MLTVFLGCPIAAPCDRQVRVLPRGVAHIPPIRSSLFDQSCLESNGYPVATLFYIYEMTLAGTGKSISTMRMILIRPTCQISITFTPPRSRFDPTEV